MPVLDWIGKESVVRHHREVPYRLLEPDPELSVRAERSDPVDRGVEAPGAEAGGGNLIVQGDNLLALKALLPRYNTGNEGWAYNDNVNSPEIRKWLGEVERDVGDAVGATITAERSGGR